MAIQSRQRVVIVGGGTAGITVAARLRRSGQKHLEVIVIEPSTKHYYQPLWTLVGAGLARKEVTERQESRVIPRGVAWIQDAVESFEPGSNTLKTRQGQEVHYDWLVVAAGIKI